MTGRRIDGCDRRGLGHRHALRSRRPSLRLPWTSSRRSSPRLSAPAVQMIKLSLNLGADASLRSALELEGHMYATLRTTPEYDEHLQRWLDRRSGLVPIGLTVDACVRRACARYGPVVALVDGSRSLTYRRARRPDRRRSRPSFSRSGFGREARSSRACGTASNSSSPTSPSSESALSMRRSTSGSACPSSSTASISSARRPCSSTPRRTRPSARASGSAPPNVVASSRLATRPAAGHRRLGGGADPSAGRPTPGRATARGSQPRPLHLGYDREAEGSRTVACEPRWRRRSSTSPRSLGGSASERSASCRSTTRWGSASCSARSSSAAPASCSRSGAQTRRCTSSSRMRSRAYSSCRPCTTTCSRCADAGERAVRSVASLGFAGMVLSDEIARRLDSLFPGRAMVNVYGCSELYCLSYSDRVRAKPGTVGPGAVHQELRVIPESADPGEDAPVGARRDRPDRRPRGRSGRVRALLERPGSDRTRSTRRLVLHRRPRLSRRRRRPLRRRTRRRHDHHRRRERPPDRGRVGARQCPGVAEVCVVGLPDERLGNAVSAFIVRSDPALTEERVLELLRDSRHALELQASPPHRVRRRDSQELRRQGAAPRSARGVLAGRPDSC